MNNYFIVNKPFNVLCQFSPVDGKKTLKDYFDIPVNAYPVGRLDYDSEGLLIITDDKKINQFLLNPLHSHEREYWVQVEGEISSEQIIRLQHGIDINVDGKKYLTRECKVKKFLNLPEVSERHPPIRYRKSVPTSWIKIILTEGKNRQVRKMTAAVGCPTLRLIRYRIEEINLEKLYPGEMRKITKQELYNLLKIKQTN